MKDVQALLEQRDELFRDQTVTALGLAEDTLIGIREYLISIDSSYEPGQFVWEDISLFENELLMLIGYVSYEPGTSFQLDGEIIEITEDNKDYFDRILRIGIPLSIVKQNSKAVVIGFLTNLNNAIEDESLDAREEIEQVEDSLAKQPSKYDFDLDELTDEQRTSLAFVRKSGKLN